MNERINELMRRAEICDGVRPGIYFDREEFAKLLIEKLCYDIMDVHGAKPEHIAFVAKQYGVGV